MMPCARMLDMHVCPMVTGIVPHVGGPVLPPGMPTTFWTTGWMATATGMCTCVGPPDVIALGSFTVMTGMLPQAKLGSLTAHGGSIVMGLPTVLVGG